MQPKEIQQPINPWQLCTANTRLTLRLNAELFTRASDLMFAPYDELSFALDFSQTADRQLRVTGHLTGEVNLECQRCLHSVAVTLDNEFAWGLVGDDISAANLPRSLDPIYFAENKLNLFAALEDELLLSLPVVAYHQAEECSFPEYTQPELDLPAEDISSEQTSAGADTHRPFLVLHQLKKGN